MPLRSYGVLKATITARRHATNRSDHYVLTCQAGTRAGRCRSTPTPTCRRPTSSSPSSAPATTRWRAARAAQTGLARPAAGRRPRLRPRRPVHARAVQAAAALQAGREQRPQRALRPPPAPRRTVHAFGEPWADPGPDRARRPRRAPEPGQHPPVPPTTTASGRTAACWSQRRRRTGRRSCCASSRSPGDRRRHRPRALIQRAAMPKPPLPDELQALLARAATPP